MATIQARFSKPAAFFFLLRLNRTIMVAILAGAAAFAAGAGTTRSLWMVLVAWLMAVGGFSLDFWADRDLDFEGPRAEIRHNPLSDCSLSPDTGLTFSIACLAGSFGLFFTLFLLLCRHLPVVPVAETKAARELGDRDS